MNGQAWLFLLCVGIAWLIVGGRAGSRVASGNRVRAGHAHGRGRALVRHEGGHLVAADTIGVRVTRAEVRNGEGVVQLHRKDVDRMSSRDYMAFMKTGEAVSGRGGCSSDRANVAAERDRMRAAGATPAQIRRTERLATGDANRYAASPQVDRWADRLAARGRL